MSNGNSYVFATTMLNDWLIKPAPFLLVKLKPIITCSDTLHALLQLRAITLSFNCFTRLSVSFDIGQSDFCGFGFTTLA